MNLTKTRLFLLISLFGLFFWSNSFASDSYGNVKSLTLRDGLNNNTIYSILTDKDGFVWLTTDMGISKYDGFNFRNIPMTEAPRSLGRMHQDAENLIYIQKLNGGFIGFDKQSEKYLPIKLSNTTDNKTISELCVVDDHVVYLTTNEGLYRAEAKYEKGNKESHILFTLSAQPLVKGSITKLINDSKGNLFFIVDNKNLIHYTINSGRTEEIARDRNDLISQLVIDGDYLWICNKYENPSFYNIKNGISRTFSDPSSNHNLANAHATNLVRVDQKNYYLSTLSGLYLLTFDSENIDNASYNIEYISSDDSANKIRLESKINDVHWNQEQNTLWVATYGGGAVKIGFNEVQHRIKSQIPAEVTGIAEDERGSVWVTTNRKGIWKSDDTNFSASTTFSKWENTTSQANSSKCNLYKDKNGNLWVGYTNGIDLINPSKNEVTSYKIEPQGVANFQGKVRQILLDSKDRLWVLTTGGMILSNDKMEQPTLLLNNDPTLKEVYSITEDTEGVIWIGTDIGLKRLNIEGNGTITYQGDYEKQIGLSQEPVYALYANNYNQIFAAYATDIIRIDGRKKESVEIHFTSKNGLNGGHILSMIDDNSGSTWAGTNSGIITIPNDKKSLFNYSSSGFCSYGCRLRNGQLLWSDSWGLFFFDPIAAKGNPSHNKLILSNVLIGGKSITVGEKRNGQEILTTAPNYQNEFIFNAKNNDFEFLFSDNQGDIMQRKVAYRLLPLEEEWSYSELGEGIKYSHLASGQYKLEVKPVYPYNQEGDVLSYDIKIKPFLFETVWIYILLLLFIGLIFAGIHYFVSKKFKQQLSTIASPPAVENSLVPLETETQHNDNNDDKLERVLFTRFAKDLCPPLSSIITQLKESLQEKGSGSRLSSKMLLAYRNSIAIFDACEQFSTIYSFDEKQTKLKIAPYAVTKVIDSLLATMNEFIRVYTIEFRYEKRISKDFDIHIDKDKINFVLHNLLSNAFVHVNYVGAVGLLLEEVTENGINYCVITVLDNGKHEVKEMRGTLLSDSLINSSAASLEVGYDVMEAIVKLHHGTISMESISGGGTKVKIKWPTQKSAFEKDTNVEFVEPESFEDSKLSDEIIVDELKMEEENIMSEIMEKEPMVTISEDGKKKTLLIVEDYADIRLFLKTFFQRDYNVLLATNGAEGVEIAKKEIPDLIICDVMMPIMDGFECCREVKDALETCHIPFIMLTGRVEDDDVIKGLESRADDYILKPFMPKILKAKVKNLIDGRVNLKRTYTRLLVTPPTEDDTAEIIEEETKVENPFISTVIKIVENNIQEPDFNVKKLASDLNMSQPTLYRKVKQYTDFTIIELIRGVRMRKAAMLLKQKQNNVQEVAEMVGYNDIPTFRKHFVDAYGYTPSTYADSKEEEK